MSRSSFCGLCLFVLSAVLAPSASGQSVQFPVTPYFVGGFHNGEEQLPYRTYCGSRPMCHHLGEDVRAAVGVAVRAVADGTIVHSAPSSGFGYFIVIAHAGPVPFASLYGHLSSQQQYPRRLVGSIRKGEIIGYVGAEYENGGYSPHLHFGIYNAVAPRDGVSHYWGSAPNPSSDDVDSVGGFYVSPSTFLQRLIDTSSVVPVARDDYYLMLQDDLLNPYGEAGILNNDTVPANFISVTFLNPPVGFTDSGGGRFTYVPPAGVSGLVEFGYSLHTATVDSLPATIHVQVNVRPPTDPWTLTATNVLQVRFTASPVPSVDTLVFAPAFGSNSGIISDVTSVYNQGIQLGSQTTFAPLSTKFFRSPTSVWPTGTIIDFSSFNNGLPIQGLVEFRVTSGSVAIDASRLTIALGSSIAGGGANFCGCVTIQSAVIVPR